MNRKVTVALLLCASMLAHAGENSSGFYFGAGLGDTHYEDDHFTKVLDSTSHINTNDEGVIGYLGYQFNNIIGIEASYIDYGKYMSNTNGFTQEPESINLAANIGYSFLGGQLRSFVVAGLGYVNANWSNLPLYAQEIRDSALSFHYGFGIQYEPDFLHGVGIRTAYVSDVYSATLESNYYNDETFTQSLSLLYISLHYKF